jgi:hypothetical protein
MEFSTLVVAVLTSVIAAYIWDRTTRPTLRVSVDKGRALGQSPGQPPHEFFHVVVANTDGIGGVVPRRPAWACSATIELVSVRTGEAIGPAISARWTSQPEPLLTVGVGGSVVNVPDVARMISGRRVDVHAHQPQQLSIAVKFEGDPDFYLFTNESYVHPQWSNPAWRIPQGTHRVRVTVYSESGRTQEDFKVENLGPKRDDMAIRPFFE